jgi:O-antigen ligase
MTEQATAEKPIPIRLKVLDVGRWACVICLFFIPVNKPATNICMAVALLATLVAPNLVDRIRLAIKHPVALGALLWWFVLAFSALYAPQSAALWRSWLGLVTFSYPLLIISLVGQDDRWRLRAWWAFGISMSLIVLISWGQFMGLIPQRHLPDGVSIYRNVVFKDYIQQGIHTLYFVSMLFAAVIWKRSLNKNTGLWLGIVLGLASIMFAIESRTALLSMIPLVILWCALVFFKGSTGKKLASAMLIVLALGVGSAWVQAQKNQSRLTQIGQEIDDYTQKKQSTSTGIRIELWKQSLVLFKQAPVMGHGLDQWHPQFLAITKDIINYDDFRKRFPHQEFLLIIVEQGFLGFSFFLVLLIGLASYIRRLAMPYKYFYISFLLLYASAGMVNNLVGDFSLRHLLLVWLGFMPWAEPRLPKSDRQQMK